MIVKIEAELGVNKHSFLGGAFCGGLCHSPRFREEI